MSGSGMIAAARDIPSRVRKSVALEREACAAALEARADEIERRVNPDTVQAHSRQLPTEEELVGAGYACRQLRVAAGDLRAGLHDQSDARGGAERPESGARQLPIQSSDAGSPGDEPRPCRSVTRTT